MSIYEEILIQSPSNCECTCNKHMAAYLRTNQLLDPLEHSRLQFVANNHLSVKKNCLPLRVLLTAILRSSLII